MKYSSKSYFVSQCNLKGGKKKTKIQRAAIVTPERDREREKERKIQGFLRDREGEEEE